MHTILDVVARLRSEDPRLTYLGENEDVAYGKFLEFELVRWNGHPRFVPSEALALPGREAQRSFLYRGQTTRYRPCLASLLRGAGDDEMQMKGRLMLERFRVAELELVLRDHPFSSLAAAHGFATDYHGLAQHYGIPTSLIDLTSSVEVAAFFAIASWRPQDNAWTPMDAGMGVLYRLDWSSFGPGYSKYFDPVGFGPGLRPARQHAWGFRMLPGADFESVPHVTLIEFEHSLNASAEIFAHFEAGTLLYPPDCLASLVEKVRDLPFVTMHAIRYAGRQDGLPEHQIDRHAERAADLLNAALGIDIVDGYELQLESIDVEIARKQVPALDGAIRRLRRGVRLVRTRKTEPHRGDT